VRKFTESVTEAGRGQLPVRIWTGQFSAFLPAIDGDDFIGVQNYSRIVV
jgi:hypothetical protein